MTKQKITLGFLCEYAELKILLAANLDFIEGTYNANKGGFRGVVYGE